MFPIFHEPKIHFGARSTVTFTHISMEIVETMIRWRENKRIKSRDMKCIKNQIIRLLVG